MLATREQSLAATETLTWWIADRDWLERYARRFAPVNGLDSDDLVSTVLVAMLARRSNECIADYRAYAATVTLNVVRRQRRYENQRSAWEGDVKGSTERHVDPADEVATRDWLQRTLTARALRVTEMRYVEMLHEREIAEVLGVTRGTVATTLHRARMLLSNTSSAFA